jgi:hypothetical protein
MEFNPMQDVPTNDEQAMVALRHERSASIADNLCGIYQCERATSATVLEALKVALKAHIDADRHAQQTRGKSTNEAAERTWWAGYEYVDASQTTEKEAK